MSNKMSNESKSIAIRVNYRMHGIRNLQVPLRCMTAPMGCKTINEEKAHCPMGNNGIWRNHRASLLRFQLAACGASPGRRARGPKRAPRLFMNLGPRSLDSHHLETRACRRGQRNPMRSIVTWKPTAYRNLNPLATPMI